MTPTDESLEALAKPQEQMDKARGEFALWWAKYSRPPKPGTMINPIAVIGPINLLHKTQHQHTAWEAWKAAKGLAK
jgi:hypothetical protein